MTILLKYHRYHNKDHKYHNNCTGIRDGPLFSPGGIVIGKKIVCMRKTQGGHSIIKRMGGWLEGLNQKPTNINPKIAIILKC